jgi:WD40 repeat protein
MLRKGDEPIPGYRLEEFLGRGQFGEVWRTTAPGGTSAALKFIDLSGTRGLKEYRGIQRVKEIRHAHLMPITALWMLDVDGDILGDQALETYDPQETARETLAPQILSPGEQPGWLVVAMLLGDKNLLDRLEEIQRENEWGIPVEELLDYMEEAAKGIDFLNTPQHDLGEGPVAIQHCDIKPANIMLVGGSVVICDFGLARMLGDAAATATGMVGSPAYMAPECVNRKPSHATDQYSLAITYFELRTGQLPFHDESYMAILDSHRHGTLDLSRLETGEREVIRKATSVAPADRYPTCVAMVRALRQAFAGPPEAKPQRSAGVFVAVIVVLMLIGGAVAWPFLTGHQGTDGDDPVVVPARETLKVVVVPANAKVLVDGQERELNASGELTLELADNERVEIEASASEDYQSLRRSLTLKQLRDQDGRFELPRSARYFAKVGRECLQSGDKARAVEQFRQAILLDGSYATPSAIRLEVHQAAVRKMAFGPGSQPWLVAASDDGTANAWRLTPGQPPPKPVALRGHQPDQPIECLAVSPDGRWIVTGGWDDNACLWDLAADTPGAQPKLLEGHTEDIVAVAVVPNRQLVVTASFDTTIRLWDLSAGSADLPCVLLEGHDYEIERLVVTPDGRWLVTFDVDGGVRRWDLEAEDRATTMTVIPPLPHRVKASLATPDSQWLVTGGDDGSIAYTHLESKLPRSVLPATGDDVESLALSRGGRFLAVGSAGGAIRVLELTDSAPPPAPRNLFNQHISPVVSLAFSPDGRWLLSGGWDKMVYLWDLEAADPTASPLRLSGHEGPVHAVVISEDGHWAASSDESGLILLWNLPECLMIHEAAAGAPIPTVPRVDA